MPLLRINADGAVAVPHAGPLTQGPTLAKALEGAGPVILMLHGYKFSPNHPFACPHRHILSLAPDRSDFRAVSWPRGLGFGGGDAAEGLGIAFGWHARGTIWAAYRQAACAGAALAELVSRIRAAAPHRPVTAIAHSLGARVVLSALPRLRAGDLRRVILLNGAEYEGTARAALTSAGGRETEAINITSRENDLFDFLLERLISPPARGDRTLGLHQPDRPNTVTLQMDHAGTLAALGRIGFSVAPPAATVCHWSSYLRAGAFPLYSAALRGDARLAMSNLRLLAPQPPEPRWSRLRPLPRPPLPSFAGRPAAP